MKRSGPLRRRTPLKPMSERRRAAQRANALKRTYERTGRTVVCARDGCSVSFYVAPASTQRFCSKACSGAANRSRVCAVCGDALAGVVKVGVKTCPKPACRKEIRARSKRGDRNPMAGPRASRKRDWYGARETCCRVCGSSDRLRLHHVVYEQHVRKRGGDVWDPDNSLTLCMTCHNKHHHAVDERLAVSQLRPENVEFAFALLGSYTADYFARYYDDDSRGALMARSLDLQRLNAGATVGYPS